jgi:hypothetical protein
VTSHPIQPVLIEQDNYQVALRLAQERWRSLDPERQAIRSGAEVGRGTDEKPVVSVNFLGQSVEVTHPWGIVRRADSKAALPLWEQILVLHYLCSERPVPTTARVIAYSEVPDGKFYDQAYQKRTKLYLLKVFGADPNRLLPASRSLGATPASFGDLSVRVPAFPRVDLYVVLWRGDEEFAPNASVLLGESIVSFLDAEDIAVLASILVGYLAKAAVGLSSTSG